MKSKINTILMLSPLPLDFGQVISRRWSGAEIIGPSITRLASGHKYLRFLDVPIDAGAFISSHLYISHSLLTIPDFSQCTSYWIGAYHCRHYLLYLLPQAKPTTVLNFILIILHNISERFK